MILLSQFSPGHISNSYSLRFPAPRVQSIILTLMKLASHLYKRTVPYSFIVDKDMANDVVTLEHVTLTVSL